MRSAWAQPRFGERWDGLDENGECPIGDDGTDMMISYNHYASGRGGRVPLPPRVGVEPTEAGYRKFKFAPVVGGGITEAEGTVGTPYGVIRLHGRSRTAR